MAGLIPRQFIDEVIARTDIVDLIDARIPLKKAGVNYVALCPFHTEKTPSFNVSREKQFYHCFGCGAHGNAIGFLMDYERQTFIEAVETLAASLGLEVPRESGPAKEPAQLTGVPLYALQEQVAQFYERQLKEHADAARAVNYMKSRGIDGIVAKRFHLGYAPPGWRNLPTQLPFDLLLQAGLIIPREQGGHYDRFRDRVMFPIRDRRGRVVGFGGRVIGDEKPKYLNSPETPVFKKHLEVYGLYELLQAVRRPERILVVEGYLDVIALAQHGIANVVATLGTAMSFEHVELLFRYTRELVFCFDGDTAGRQAAWKALETSLPALGEGRSIRFLMLPAGYDPDQAVREEGGEKFAERIIEAQPLSDYFYQHLSDAHDLHTLEGRAAVLHDAGRLLEKMPPTTFRELMQARLQELAGPSSVKWVDSAAPRRKVPSAASNRSKPSAVRMILALLVQHPSLVRLIDPESRRCLERDPKAGALARRLLSALCEQPGISTGGILEKFRTDSDEKLVKALSVWEILLPQVGLEAEFADALKRYCRQHRDARLEALFKKGRVAELSADEREEMRRLLSAQ